ncbi:Pyruvate/2-oxoglutarate dehydrogenase complex, dihydrolipoamide acyltransferase (E2) component or related enzyme [Halalkaliarchaeum sp. AArc-CO]|uniref:dihydrolipoamide acetyltransferase family protein n=1 Tax=unclassified Halalkaliarchaeum TaxID=2678344 RepID=UPI00217E9B1E|nr:MULTISPECIES: dihydrolipoamide acetyltransferase family protein [unclassified Halalkaliarchaeum]MDR5672012.1 dihydrolipoamide acetyltransferase family protein [Halalkaliarchaeum sp. AArc-GB]UWG51517.1 Pyruvate/2-oxoglutarate dehydrogenase complex, dihydrolipoamide acyltransferase (E2) component or related enzyme [Halalkaliarchaeum sp. AArc-CO]
MTITEFKLPDVGEGVAEGELVSWLVEPGDAVSEDQPVAEVETDKALVEVPSPYDGTVKQLFVEEGEMVPVGDVIISFELPDDEETAEAEPADEEPADGEPADREPAEVETPDDRVFAPPSARRLARELGVDIAAVSGSGPGGRVTEADVRNHAESTATQEPEPTPSAEETVAESAPETEADTEDAAVPSGVDAVDRDNTLAVPATRRVARELGVDIDDVPTDQTRDGEPFVTEQQVREYAEALEADAREPAAKPTAEPAAAEAAGAETATPTPGETGAGARPEETVPYRGVRRTIGDQMEQSKYTAPHVTHHDTVEVSALVEARERLKPRGQEQDVSLTYLPFVMKAVVEGLKEYPVLNSQLREEDEEIALKKYYNVGIAVATDAGLMVPVVEDVDRKGLFELSRQVHDLASRARDRKLDLEEMRGGTFTITNFGAIGGEYATPIINYPETAILGLGAIEKRPVVEDDEVVARPTLPLSLSIDHRVIDGAEAAAFTNTVMSYLNEPLLLLE